MRARLRGFPDIAAARSAAYQVVADASVAALPLIGIISDNKIVSCFVEVPLKLVSIDPEPARRTVLRMGGYREILLSLPDLLGGGDNIGFLLASRPLRIAGDQYQPDDADEVIALAEGVVPAVGTRSIGPIRCQRCNYPVPAARVRILGSLNCLCIRCQQTEERR
jgi:hypothetical protein